MNLQPSTNNNIMLLLNYANFMLCCLLPAGETEGFSDGKYSLHLYMYKGPGATICWATRDHFNYKQEVTTKHHMKCNRQKDDGEIEYFDKTEESTAKVDGNTFGRLVFHSRYT